MHHRQAWAGATSIGSHVQGAPARLVQLEGAAGHASPILHNALGSRGASPECFNLEAQVALPMKRGLGSLTRRAEDPRGHGRRQVLPFGFARGIHAAIHRRAQELHAPPGGLVVDLALRMINTKSARVPSLEVLPNLQETHLMYGDLERGKEVVWSSNHGEGRGVRHVQCALLQVWVQVNR